MKNSSQPNVLLQENIELLTSKLINIISREALAPDLEALVLILRKIQEISAQGSTPVSGLVADIKNLISSLTDDSLLFITRAFSHLLNLTEVAEQYHRVRRRRWHQQAGHSAQPGSLEAVIPKLMNKGLSQAALQNALCELKIELVLTAHPTEVLRRTLIQKHHKIAAYLAELDRKDLTPYERELILDSLQSEIISAWQTEEIRQTKPTPIDEAKWGLAIVEESLWQAVPQFMRDLNRVFKNATHADLPITLNPIRFSSWMGGDRDGNPNVTAKVTKEVILITRKKALSLFIKDIESLANALSMHKCSDQIRALVRDAEKPYRALLNQIKHELFNTMHCIEGKLKNIASSDPANEPLLDTEQLLLPLTLCYQSLIDHGAAEIARGPLLDLIYKTKCFGLCLLPLDIRQEAGKHTELMNEITQQLGLGSYKNWDEAQRQNFLNEIIAQSEPYLLSNKLNLPPEIQEYLDTFKMITELPRDSFGAYVISMASCPSDVLLVLALQKAVGIKEPLRVVPLFETLTDLNNAASCMEGLFSIQGYKESCQGNQEIMIGYSDSAKDAGFLAASWALYEAQESLVNIGKKNNVNIIFFHGRGGSAGRGGGPTHLAIRSLPPGSINGRLRVTQQGEVIRHRFGLQKIAERTLAIYTTATLEASLFPKKTPEKSWRELMKTLSEEALKGYQKFTKEEPSFTEYFQTVTPINELNKITIGSRPQKRNNTNSIQSLRAIPWVFSWTQNRLLLPAWYGIGKALKAALQAGKLPLLQDMAKNWSYFSSLTGMVEMVLAKANPHITNHYEQILVPKALHQLGIHLRDEFDITQKLILEVLQQEKLLNTNPTLERSIAVRSTYLLPLHLLQVELLKRYRTNNLEPQSKIEVEHALLISIAGIAAGMHNTG